MGAVMPNQILANDLELIADKEILLNQISKLLGEISAKKVELHKLEREITVLETRLDNIRQLLLQAE